MLKWLFGQDAAKDEKGSFCDTESKHHYDNVSDLTKADRVNDANARGEEVVLMDDPYDGSSRRGGIDQDKRHNLFYAEGDDQGTPSPRKHKPGR